MAKAYSYTRFSTPDQSKGNSYERQLERARQYAVQHGLELDTTITYHDAGASGYNSSNAVTGRLGEFLQAVHAGVVESGSYLLIESLDRLSRDKILPAQALFLQIIGSGITIVTTIDEKIYSEERINANPFLIFEALFVLIRANEESTTKSKRHSDNWERMRKKALDEPMSGACPGWLRVLCNDAGRRIAFEVIPERAAVVREIFDLHRSGMGQENIAKLLNQRDEPRWGVGLKKAKLWHKTYVGKILRNPAVVGDITPMLCQKQPGQKSPKRIPLETMKGYYPAIIDREVFYQVQAEHENARIRGKKTSQKVQFIFARLAVCGNCGATMTRVYKGKGKGPERLVCTAAKAGKCGIYRSIRLAYVESFFIRYIKDYGIPRDVNEAEALDSRVERITLKIIECQGMLDNLIDAIKAGSVSRNDTSALQELFEVTGQATDVPFTVIDEIRMIESEIKRLETYRATMYRKKSLLHGARLKENIDSLFLALENLEEKQQINQALHRLCSKIEFDVLDGLISIYWHHSADRTVIPCATIKLKIDPTETCRPEIPETPEERRGFILVPGLDVI